MGKKKLEEFLNEKSKVINYNKIDWELEKNNFLESVYNLYENIENWLNPFIEKKQIFLNYGKIEINEEYIGEYEINTLGIYYGDDKAIIKPIGRNIIGGKGRVDLYGKNRDVKLLLVNEECTKPRIDSSNEILSKKSKQDSNLVWKISTPPPDIEFILLNEDNFLEILLKVIQ